MNIPRPEYPRPQFVRTDWLCLNGPWEFAFDDADAGERQHWWQGTPPFERVINVPFAYQAALSGIGDVRFHDVVWYRREFDLPAAWAERDLLLHFGAVDYRARVWVNGQLAVEHEGGHTPFSADITALCRPGGNIVTVRAEDPSTDRTIARGKQYWREQSADIFYTRTTGIWQTVWLEPAPRVRLQQVHLTPDLGRGAIGLQVRVAGPAAGLKLQVTAALAGETVASGVFALDSGEQHSLLLPAAAVRPWSPEEPQLYDLNFILLDAVGQPLDQVQSYCGLRQVSTEGGLFRLNGSPYYQRLVLDQGYWPESLLTPPSEAAIRRDIELTLAMGFNGVRKHQKVEDPLYLYWADRLGLLVWAEMPSAYEFSEVGVHRIHAEWAEAVQRQYNHPCIVAWVPMNESWGVPALPSEERHRQHVLSLYHLTRALDSTRPVSSNDGWEQSLTDLFAVHDYAAEGETLRQRYSASREAIDQERPGRRVLRLPGYPSRGEPLLITEFGGISFQMGEQAGWGYSGAADPGDLLRRYRSLVEALHACPNVVGWCYTQLTDVEQEINGLLTADRRPKVDPAAIRRINNPALRPDAAASD